MSVATTARRLRARFALLIIVPFVIGCAGTLALPPAPGPAEIPELQAALDRDPTSLPLRVRLAEAYRLAGQPDAALIVLEPVSSEPGSAFQLGLVYEDLDRAADARRLYQTFIETGRSGALKEQARMRLAALERNELEEAIRNALARERELAATDPAPNTVGIFPFLAVTDDPGLKPLGTALAELLTTDLSQTDRLTVVERTQVSALLRELELAESGRVDPATASRTGRLLGAANLVQGRLEAGGSDISVQVAVVKVPSADAPATPVMDRGSLARLFEMEKQLALSLYEQLGIELTPAERDRVMRQPTSNVQALLSFGFGLEAADAGLHNEAATHFVQALTLDPGFDLARTHWTRADQALRAGTTSAAQLGRLSLAEADAVGNWQTRFEPVESLIRNPAVRDAVSEVLGTEGTVRRGTVTIIISAPSTRGN